MRPLLPGLRCGPRLVGQRVLDTQPAQPRGHVHLVTKTDGVEVRWRIDDGADYGGGPYADNDEVMMLPASGAGLPTLYTYIQ